MSQKVQDYVDTRNPFVGERYATFEGCSLSPKIFLGTICNRSLKLDQVIC